MHQMFEKSFEKKREKFLNIKTFLHSSHVENNFQHNYQKLNALKVNLI
jgi:hypothetical protein